MQRLREEEDQNGIRVRHSLDIATAAIHEGTDKSHMRFSFKKKVRHQKRKIMRSFANSLNSSTTHHSALPSLNVLDPTH